MFCTLTRTGSNKIDAQTAVEHYLVEPKDNQEYFWQQSRPSKPFLRKAVYNTRLNLITETVARHYLPDSF